MTQAYRASSRRALTLVAVLVALPVLLWLALTSAEPWAPARPAATAGQIAAGRAAFRQVQRGLETGGVSVVQLSADDLGGISALVSQGFAPNRFDAQLDSGMFAVTLSRPLLGRWLNAQATVAGESVGFPKLRLQLGLFSLPAWASRVMLDAGRWLLVRRGARLPPLDALVQASAVSHEGVWASIALPTAGAIDTLIARDGATIDRAAVARIYCRLTAEQRRAPDPLFAHQLRRAFAAAAPTPAQHGAALVALAMLVVDPRAGQLAGVARAPVRDCLLPPPVVTLQGRADLPKHWSLSAALTVAKGEQLAEVMGAWKELADSLATQIGGTGADPSGFSFVDLSADRAGYLYARKSLDPTRLAAARARLLAADDEMLLPRAQLQLSDGMSNAEWVRRFGGTDDPRYLAAVGTIDQALRRTGID